jgi:hypothetical protein
MQLMQRPSFGEWLIPIVLSGFAVVTAWAGHNMEMKLWVAVAAYVGLFSLGLVAHLYRLREYKKWKARDRVVMKSSMATLISQPPAGSTEQAVGLVQSCLLKITNQSSKRVKITSVWLEDCGKSGGDLALTDARLPVALDPADESPYMSH